MEKMLKEKQLQEEQRKRERDEVERILSQVLTPDAMKYLAAVRSSSPSVAGKIEEILQILPLGKRRRFHLEDIDQIGQAQSSSLSFSDISILLPFFT